MQAPSLVVGGCVERAISGADDFVGSADGESCSGCWWWWGASGGGWTVGKGWLFLGMCGGGVRGIAKVGVGVRW